MNADGMLNAEFRHLPYAEKWREEHGGWIFDADRTILWFSLAYTPSDIMRDPATRGLSGVLR